MRKGDGDGTVPLVSLGLMCRKGWKTKKLNPGGIQIVTHELKHDAVPMYLDPRCAHRISPKSLELRSAKGYSPEPLKPRTRT